MAASLTRTDDALELSLAGCRGSEFQDVLTKAKEVPGRRFDSARKLWLFPPEPAIAERLLLAIRPDADDSIEEWVTESRVEGERDLVTPLPEDGELLIPWATERMPWQPEEINGLPMMGLKPHQRALVGNMQAKAIMADDQGLGKCAMTLSFIAESLVRYENDRKQLGVQQGIQSSERGEGEAPEPRKRGQNEGQNRSVDRGEEEHALRGLQGIAAAAVHGFGSRQGGSALFSGALAVNSFDSWKVQGADGGRGDGEVRGPLSELPSAEALARAPRLIVCPKSVVGVWNREIKRWLGEDAYIIAGGSTSAARKRLLEEAIEGGGWVIVNYEQLRVHKVQRTTRTGGKKVEWKMKEPLFESTQWLAVIADECHRAKNRKALQTRGLFRVTAPIMLGLSGTPLMNQPGELWSLLHWLFPEEYTSYWRFFDTYVDYVEGYRGRDIIGVKNPEALAFELHDRVYRRTKRQVLKDLPEKQRIIIPVELDGKQRKLYAEAEKNLWLEVEKAIEEGDRSAAELAAASDSGFELYQIPNGAARLVRLRQVLSSPALLGGEDHSAKLDAVEEAILDNSHKPHVVFSEFVQTCSLLASRLEKHGLDVAIYTGETTGADRTEIEDGFQRGEIDVVIGTIGAMREGITLTAADTVHFIERAWVPGLNEQAEDRLHRIGQQNAVTVYIYEGAKTVDDGRVTPTLRLKEKIVRTILPKDEIKEAQYV